MDKEGIVSAATASRKTYLRVIDDVLKNVRADWLNGGVDVSTLDTLRSEWTRRLEEAAMRKGETAKSRKKEKEKEEEKKEEGAPEEKKIKRVESQKELGEESLSSLTEKDGSDDELGEQFEDPDHTMLCQFETVKKTKNQWKVKLRNGVVAVDTGDGQIIDYRFTSALATLTRW